MKRVDTTRDCLRASSHWASTGISHCLSTYLWSPKLFTAPIWLALPPVFAVSGVFLKFFCFLLPKRSFRHNKGWLLALGDVGTLSWKGLRLCPHPVLSQSAWKPRLRRQNGLRSSSLEGVREQARGPAAPRPQTVLSSFQHCHWGLSQRYG